MNKKQAFFLLSTLLLLASCATKVQKNQRTTAALELEQLQQVMSGTFSSREQAAQDSTYYDINLVMFPIWEDRTDGKWLYVEQAVTAMVEKPYRQRVYQLGMEEDGSFSSKVYELQTPSRFTEGWNKRKLFRELTTDSLNLRQGCAVYLQKDANGCYTGATKEGACKSTLRGASYASSEVTICRGQLVSWDQGWNEAGEQVWGATEGGYIFKKID
ncbi:MAG: chromophore lyase CpcT/CpeT [Bacteroidota bacterium]